MLVITSNHLLRIRAVEKSLRCLSLFPCLRSENEDPKSKANEKLNLLLQSIIKDNEIVDEAKPQKVAFKQTKFKSKVIRKEQKQKSLGQKIVEAAKEVADKVEGKPEQTEAELLHKLLYKNESLQSSVLKATNNKKLSNLLSGMEVENTPISKKKEMKDASFNRAEQVRSLLRDRSFRKSRAPDVPVQLNIFSSKALGIFNRDIEWYKDEVKLNTWDHCVAKELRLSVTHPPSNIYEQLIIWTNRGILWKFPIDNEQGMDEEQKVSFSDHVFLESYLDGWCPERGPIRHFMELVCVGLSRNYWLTAQEKKDHVLWYREYFLAKKDIIKEVGAGDIQLSENPVTESLSSK